MLPAQRWQNNDLLIHHYMVVCSLSVNTGEKWIWHFIDCSPPILWSIEPNAIHIWHLALSSTGLVANRWETSFFTLWKSWTVQWWANNHRGNMHCVVGHKMVGCVLIWQVISLSTSVTSAFLTHLHKVYIVSVQNKLTPVWIMQHDLPVSVSYFSAVYNYTGS